MSRIARQPGWWIALTIVYFAFCAISLALELPEISSLFEALRLPLGLVVTAGASAFAFGFRFGGFRLWAAIATLYVADTGPYITGIIFRLARFTVNSDYHVYRSTSSYLVTISVVVYELIALIRIIQSFRTEKALAETFA